MSAIDFKSFVALLMSAWVVGFAAGWLLTIYRNAMSHV